MSIQIERMAGVGGEEYLYFGDENTNGTWRFIVSGTELSIQKREGGVWVEKSSFVP